jgi:hypothetical protein
MTTSLSPRSASVHPTRQQLDELDALLQRMLDLPVNQVDEAEAADQAETPVPEFRPPVSYKVPINDTPPLLEPRVVPAEEPPRRTPEPVFQAPAPPRPVTRAPAVPQQPVIPPAAPPAPAPVREPGPDDWIRLASTWQPSAQTWQPLAQSWQQAARSTERTPAPAPAAPAQWPDAPPPELSFTNPSAAALEPAAPVYRDAPAVYREVDAPKQESLEDLIVPRNDHDNSPAPKPDKKVVQQASDSGPGIDWWQWPFVAVNATFDLITLPLGPLGTGLRSRAGRNLLAAAGVACLGVAAVLVAADWIGWIW